MSAEAVGRQTIRRGVAAVAVLISFVVADAGSSALPAGAEPACPAPGPYTSFTDGLGPGALTNSVTPGPDGNVWFTEGSQEHPRIGRITPSGAITEFTDGILENSSLTDIVTGPDGNLWATDNMFGRIYKMTPVGEVTVFNIRESPSHVPKAFSITAGTDGNLWFTETDRREIGRITPDGTVTYFPATPPTTGLHEGRPLRIVTDDDGVMWFTVRDGSLIGRITTAGEVSFFPVPPSESGQSNTEFLTVADDGAIWFSYGTHFTKLGRMTPAGSATAFDVVTSNGRRPAGPLTAGPDGAIWFTMDDNIVRRIDAAGNVTTHPGLNITNDITTGPDGNLWISRTTGSIDRLTLPTPTGRFVDDDCSVHESMIDALSDADVVAGCSPIRYCPSATVRRDQMASFLARALDLPAADKDYFTDDNGSFHEDNINRVAAAGIAAGSADGRYGPRSPVSRGQMASLLARGFDLPDASRDHFTDDNGSVHEDSINRVAESDISVGCATSSTSFCPSGDVRRDQMASFVGRALGLE